MWLVILIIIITASNGKSRRSLRNQITSSNKRSAGTHGNDSAGLVERQHELLAHRLLAPAVSRFESPRLQLVNSHCGKGLQDTPQQYRWAQGFCEPRMVIDEERLLQRGLQEFPTSFRAWYYHQRWPHSIIWCLWVLIYCYVIIVV